MENVNPEPVPLRRHGSSVSLQSTTLSTASGSSFKRSNRSLREKLNEIETFKDILFGQIDTLQKYFDACAEHAIKNDNTKSLDLGDTLRPIDFKGEAITFRETTSGVVTTLQHCLDIITQRDDCWKKKLDREVDRRRRAEEMYRQVRDDLSKVPKTTLPGPDLEVSGYILNPNFNSISKWLFFIFYIANFIIHHKSEIM